MNGKKIINLFYCDPGASWQKGKLEKNHEYIRYVLPKGLSFDFLLEDNIIKLMNNINNSPRGELFNQSPYKLFENNYKNETQKLKLFYIKGNDVNLSKNLLNDYYDREKVLNKTIKDLEYYYLSQHKKLDNKIKKTNHRTFS